MANNSSDVGGVKVESDRDVDLTLGDSNRAGSSAFSSELSGMGQIRKPVPVEPRTGEALAHWVAAHWEKVTLVVSVAGAIGAAVVSRQPTPARYRPRRRRIRALRHSPVRRGRSRPRYH